MPRILAIDNSNDNLISLKAILQDAFPDSVFYSALNGPKGIELAIAVDPDVILLDIIMPQMDGFEVCRLFKQDERLCVIPVVFLTAMNEERNNRIKALDAGGEAFLYKPIDKIELTAQIRAMLKIRESNRLKRNEHERLELLVNKRSLQLEKKQLELINLLVELKTENKSRKAIEEELRVSEEKYRSLFETMPQGAVYQNAEGEIIFANKSAERILGLTIDQMIGRTSIDPCWKAIHEDGSDFPGDTHPISISLKTGKEIKNVVMGIYNPKNKGYCWINVSAIPQFKPGESKPYQVYATFDEITEQKLTEEAHRKSELRLEKAEMASKSGNWELHLDSQILFASKGAIKIYGADSNTFDLQKIKDISLPEYRKTLDQALNNLIQKNEPYHVEFKIRRLDNGEIRDIESQADFDHEKRILFGIIQDITERKQNEAAMLEAIAQANRFRKALDNVSAFIYIKDDQSRYVYANRPTLELFKCTADELTGSDDTRFFPPETVIQLREVDRRILDYGEDTAKEIESFSAEGNRQVYWEVKTPMYDETNNNQVWGICGISTDITERKQAEEALKENEARLREAVATKDKFFSIIAHDLKNPFNSILGFSELLVERIAEQNYENIEEYSTIIQNSSQRVMNLLMNLLEWSRSQTGRMEFNPEFVDMVVLLNQVRELLDDSAHQKAISIELKIPRNAPVIADKAMISTVLRNLISNAVKFTAQGGAIMITLVQKQKELMVSVADNGVGIKKELIENLFKIEESQSMPGTNNEQGTGLGLILCKEFVEKHGGKIWVESDPNCQWEGKGSTFYFTIPKK